MAGMGLPTGNFSTNPNDPNYIYANSYNYNTKTGETTYGAPQTTNPAPGVVGVSSGSSSSNLAAPTTETQSSSSSGGGARNQSSSQQTSQSGSYFSNPALVDSMARNFAGLYENVVPTYNEFMQDPVNSNLFQTQLKSLLASLAPGEQDSRNQLTDRFRAAGGLRSGAHAVGGARLEGDIIGRRQNAAGTLLGQTIQQMSQLLGLPLSQMAPLIQALELQQSSSQGTSQSTGSRDPTTQSQSASRSSGGGGSGGAGGSRGSGGSGGSGGGGGGGEPPYDDTTFNGGGGEGEWNYYGPSGGGGGGGGDDFNDYYNRPDDTYSRNLNTEVDVPGLGVSTQGGGDDYNDYYNRPYTDDGGF